MPRYENPKYGSKAFENETDGEYNNKTVFCPTQAYGDCPYCDQCNICHIANPMYDCDDFGSVYDSWEDWLINCDEMD